MGLLSRFKPQAKKIHAETSTEVTNGAYGGVRARVFPTNINPIYSLLPSGAIGTSGISARIAARPNSAPMLSSSNFHTNVPGIGRLKGMATVGFRRGTDNVHPAAVSDAEHIRANYGVHPTVRRKVLRGEESL